MLGIPLDFSPVGIHKDLGVTQALMEERLELVPRDWDRNLCIISPLILLPAKADPVLEEGRGKENLDRLRGSGGSKVVFTLLTEVVTVYVGLSVVYVQGTGLQFLPGHLRDDESWDERGSGNRNRNLSLQNGLKNPLQVIFRVLGNTSISGKLRPWGSFRLFGNF